MEPMEDASTVEQLLLQRAARKRIPMNGSLELLPLCNMNCDMCYVRLSRKEMEQRGRLHTAEEWIALAKQMEQAGVLFLLLTGGEPLLFPGFRELYLALKQMGMVLTINTNGTLIDQDWATFFGEHKPRRINITLYGASEEAYETLCHYPGGFAKTIQAIRRLQEQGVAVKINGSVTKRNRKDMGGIYQIGRELDIPVHMDTYMLPGLHDRQKPVAQQARLNPAEAARANVRARKAELEPAHFAEYVRQTIQTVEAGGKLYPREMSCQAGKSSFTINWQGQMRPCVSMSEPAVDAFAVGFAAAWKKITEGTEGLLLQKACASCPLRPVCPTCVASARLETGRYDGMPDYICEYARVTLEELRREAAALAGTGPVPGK